MFKCICNFETDNKLVARGHRGYCKLFKDHLETTLNHDFLSNYFNNENGTIYGLNKMFHPIFTSVDIQQQTEKYGFKACDKEESIKRANITRAKNIESGITPPQPERDSVSFRKNGVLVKLDRTHVTSILNQEFFDKHMGEDKKLISEITKDILHDEFSYVTVSNYAKKFGYKASNRSDAAKKSYDKNVKTNLEKYGVENPSQLEEIKRKKTETMIRNFGVEHHLQKPEQMEKQKVTNQSKYGTDNVSQVDEVKDLKRDTFLEHYGIPNIFCDSEYIKEKFMDKYGVTNASKIPEVQIKKQETTFKNHGTPHFGHLSSRGRSSKMSIKLFDSITNRLDINPDYLMYSGCGGEYRLQVSKTKLMFLDYVILHPTTKLAIEFNGDVWHANPSIYLGDDKPLFTDHDTTASEIWELDRIKSNFIVRSGFQLLTIWERDYLRNEEDTIRIAIKFITDNCKDIKLKQEFIFQEIVTINETFDYLTESDII